MKIRFISALQREETLGIRNRVVPVCVSAQAFYWGQRIGGGSCTGMSFYGYRVLTKVIFSPQVHPGIVFLLL